jgi:hypothetical protein
MSTAPVPRRAPRSRAIGALIVLLALGASSCSARGASLGTTSAPCYHALPAAASAVRHRGEFVGVRLVSATKIKDRVPAAAALGRSRICLVAYKGGYTPAQVSDPLDDQSGTYAVVGVNQSGSTVLGTLVLTRLPLAFRHSV